MPLPRRSRLFAWGALLAGPLGLLVGCEGAGPIGGFGGRRPQPEEDIWAIRCITLHGQDRFQRAEAYATALKQIPALKPELVRIISDEDGTAIFYGRYRRNYRTERGGNLYQPNHLKDLETIRSLRLETGNVWPFILATMDVLPTHRSSHPEWDLSDQEGYWSFQVAVFYNTEEFRSRRSAAEEYCRYLREEKNEEAYYHHGLANSSVCIGVYPFGAVAEVRQEDPLAGRVRTTMTIVDPKMLEVQKRYPLNLENGHKVYDITRDGRTGEIKERTPRPSFPVIMPKAQQRLREMGGG